MDSSPGGFIVTEPVSPLLLAHGPLPVPALEEDLFRIGVQQAHYSKVCDHLSAINQRQYIIGHNHG